MPRLAPLLLALLLCGAAGPLVAAEPTPRIVSLNPSLTAMLVALEATDHLVGIDDYSARQQAGLAHLPTVGGLFSPSLESVVALAPDVVVMVPSAQQRDLRSRLVELGIRVLPLPNIALEELLGSIETLGGLVGCEEAARQRVAAIRSAWREVGRATAGRPRPRTVLVVQRDPLYLVGRGSYIHAMLDAAGADNAAGVFEEPYPRAGLEWLVAAAPELILDASEDRDPLRYWRRWPSLPAVANGRVVAIPAERVTLPGPYLDRSLRILAETIHGPGVLRRQPVATR